MSLQLRKRVFELLKQHPEERFKAREIADWILQNYPDEANEKLERSASLSTEAELLNQLVAEIGANRPQWQKAHLQLRTTEGRPRRYYWSQRTEQEEVELAEKAETDFDEQSEDEPKKISEKDLYPILIEFMKSEFQSEGFRIEEGRGSNRKGRGGNKWLYPDIVGIEALTKGFNNEVVEALKGSGDQRARLWSFEAKKLLNRSNVRESYFQAVSNSSWANFGYLVTDQIEGSDTIQEIQMLYAVHGIGLIELDVDSPTESTVRIPARERSAIEWGMCNRLATENRDFEKFMRRVRHFYQTGDL